MEDTRVPPKKGFVRAEIVLNGWHIKPLPEKDGRASCGVTFVNITKMHGQIPAALLKMGEKEGGEMVSKLKKKVTTRPMPMWHVCSVVVSSWL